MRRLLLLLLLLLLLAACGSDEKSPAPEDTPQPTATATPTATLTPPPSATPAPAATALPPTATAAPTETLAPLPTETVETYQALEGHALGPQDAYLTIIMYGDFQCELCARYARDLEAVRAGHPNDIRLVWRHMPMTDVDDKAVLAAQAAEAAGAQGAFWEMHDELFAHQAEWVNLSPEDFRAVLRDYASTVGLDVAAFDAALDAGTYASVVEGAQGDAAALEIVAAPMLLLNGLPFSGRDDRVGLEEAAELVLLERRQFEAPPPMIIDPAQQYRATLTTEKGDIVINLFADRAPVTVNNFVFLAQQGWYNGIRFHYVIPGFFAQTGDPTNSGLGSPGYTIPDEPSSGLSFDRAGLVAMAHPPEVPDSAGSEFFITLAPLEPRDEWDAQYTIFGEVVSGMDVVQSLTPRNVYDPVAYPDPPPGDLLISVTVEPVEP